MKKQYVYGIIAISIIALLGVGFVAAYQGSISKGNRITEQEKDDFRDAIENKDYAAWKSLMEKRIAEMQSQITQEHFNRIVEEHKEMTAMNSAIENARQEFCKTNNCSSINEKPIRMHNGFEGLPMQSSADSSSIAG
ncbi:MAG: hypothetical protein ACP5OG_01210 [Candidatus Nanoarchaeia archaeon]